MSRRSGRAGAGRAKCAQEVCAGLEIEADHWTDAEGRRETAEEARSVARRSRGCIRTETGDCRRYYDKTESAPVDGHVRGGEYPFRRIADVVAYAQAHAEADKCSAVCPRHPNGLPNWRNRTPPARRRRRAAISVKSPRTRPREFEEVLFELAPGSIGRSRWRRATGSTSSDCTASTRTQLPFELVVNRIAEYLRESVRRRAIAQHIAATCDRREDRGR